MIFWANVIVLIMAVYCLTRSRHNKTAGPYLLVCAGLIMISFGLSFLAFVSTP